MITQPCFKCGEEIKRVHEYKMIGFDNPYINVFFHKDCWKLLGGHDLAIQYITQNSEKMYNLLHKSNERKKK